MDERLTGGVHPPVRKVDVKILTRQHRVRSRHARPVGHRRRHGRRAAAVGVRVDLKFERVALESRRQRRRPVEVEAAGVLPVIDRDDQVAVVACLSLIAVYYIGIDVGPAVAAIARALGRVAAAVRRVARVSPFVARLRGVRAGGVAVAAGL